MTKYSLGALIYSKNPTSKTTSTSTPGKQPPVVVRKGGPSPEIIRPSKENLGATKEFNCSPDFQEQNMMDSSPIPMDQGIQTDFTSHHLDIERRSVYAELFEEQIQELDRDINKFDSAPKLSTENISCTGKENNFESLTINEIFELGRTQAHAQPLHQPTRKPLSILPDTSNLHTVTEATWKRIAKNNTGTDIIMEGVVGKKRSSKLTGDHSNLQQKKNCFSRRQE